MSDEQPPSPRSIRFLSVQDVLDIHTNTMEYEGGAAGVRDHGMLDAAVQLPRQSFGGEYLHDGLAAMAATYLFHLCQNHPFIDGNKRTAFAASLVFLIVNGVQPLPEQQAIEAVIVAISRSEMSKDEVVVFFQSVIDV